VLSKATQDIGECFIGSVGQIQAIIQPNIRVVIVSHQEDGHQEMHKAAVSCRTSIFHGFLIDRFPSTIE
jgi:hypothetical protein